MAFISKVGNLLKQSVSKHINSELSASNPSIFQAIRCKSSSKLFVGAQENSSILEFFLVKRIPGVLWSTHFMEDFTDNLAEREFHQTAVYASLSKIGEFQ